MRKVVLLLISAALIFAAAGCLAGQAAAQEKRPGAAAPPAKAVAEPAPQNKAPQGFFQILFSGGPIGVVIMLALIGTSLTAAYLVFENALSIRKEELIPAGLSDEVRDLVSAGQYSQAIKVCRDKPCFLSFVLMYGLNEADGGWSEVEKASEDALGEQSAPLVPPGGVSVRRRQHRPHAGAAGDGDRNAHGVQGGGGYRGSAGAVAPCRRHLSSTRYDGRPG